MTLYIVKIRLEPPIDKVTINTEPLLGGVYRSIVQPISSICQFYQQVVLMGYIGVSMKESTQSVILHPVKG